MYRTVPKSNTHLHIFNLKSWFKTIKSRRFCQNQHFTQNQLPTSNRQVKLIDPISFIKLMTFLYKD